MEKLKCCKCDKDYDWYYETKNNINLYCDKHLPSNKFIKFLGYFYWNFLVYFL